MSARLLPRKKYARRLQTPARGEPLWVGLSFLGFSLLVCLLLAQTALGASPRTHRPAGDIGRHRVTGAGTPPAGVCTEAGKGDRRILFRNEGPDRRADGPAGRVFNLRSSKELSAFVVDAAPPAE